MPAQTKYVCDYCNVDRYEADAHGWYVVRRVRANGVVDDAKVFGPWHFCGVECLRAWVF